MLLLKNEIDSQHQKQKPNQVIHPDLGLKCKGREDHKHQKRDHLLNDFQLQQRKAASVTFESETVGGHLETVFKKAISQLITMTPMSGNLPNQLFSASFR